MESVKAISSTRRKHWAEQIRLRIDLLHEIGVVWGDAKPDNGLINSETDDSFTNGLVDAGLIETREGDEQGVKKIHDFLAI